MLILPVENQVRELDAKLLLACAAAERGFPVVLGSRPYVNFAMPFLHRGVFVAKSMRPRSVLMFNLIRDLGHVVVAWDEESLVRFQSPEYYPWRFSEETFEPIQHLFAWGQDDAEMFSAYPGYRGAPIHVTGNPRTDLLRKELRGYFQPEVDSLRGRFGDFILINTNFSFVNAFVPKLNLVLKSGPMQSSSVSRTGQGMSLAFAQGLSGHQQAIFDNFRRLIPRVSEWFPDRQIVLRPHPSEDHGVWNDLVSDLKNVHLIHEGNVVPWLMACKVLLHNGCTTAVEAAVLGTPAITYQPVTSGCYDYPLPNSLSHQALAADEVRGLIDGILSDRLGPVDAARKRKIFGRHLEATEGRLAADRVVDVLEAEGYRSRLPSRPGAARFARSWLVTNGRTMLKHINMLRRNHWNSAEYHAHRFPDIDVAEIDNRIDRLRKQLGRFEGLRARQVSRYIFSVEGPGAGRPEQGHPRGPTIH